MYSYTMIQWMFFFYLYCFAGWLFESAYVSIDSRKLTNRGFLRGPFLPLYGCGAIMMLLVSQPFQDNIFLVYIAGCVGATALEYVTGVLMEKLFKVRYWDYSEKKFNYKGHICLESSLLWGFFTVMMTRFLHVQVEKFVFLIPYKALSVITVIITVLIAMDFALSFKAAIDIKDLLATMENTKKELQNIQKRLDNIFTAAGESIGSRKDAIVGGIDEIKNGIEDKLERLKKLALSRHDAYLESRKGEINELVRRYAVNVELRNRISSIRDFFQRDMLRSNPSMKSSEYPDSLEELKQSAAGKSSMKSGEYPDSLEELKQNATSKSSMKSSEYPDSLEELKQSAAGKES